MYGTSYYGSSYRGAESINTAMARVYGHMGLAVVTSMIVSYFVGTTPSLLAFFFTGVMKWIVMFLPLVLAFVVPWALSNAGKTMAPVLLHVFAAAMGLSFSVIFAIYQMGSIAGAFMSAAVLFGVMSFYGYFTKKSLDSLGKWMFVGLIAIVIASIINLFVPSEQSVVIRSVISALAIVIFTGLTAYDTQKIRETLMYDDDHRLEIMGALTLYMDFINLFLSLLQLFGNRRD
jgi:FtsH-binding integral membrane protein